MVTFNAQGEIADFVNESQFEGGESPEECCAFCGALCHSAGQPGHGPTGTGEQVDQLADSWYARLEGSNTPSNMNGMSLATEYTMLAGMQLPYAALSLTGQNTHDIAQVKLWLSYGYPVIICGAETGMYDLALGDIIPYSWPPGGNHCIVACGIASDGNLLVRDTASIAPTGVRPGPRHYDASRMHLVSATAIQMPWLPPVSVTEASMKGNTMSSLPNGWSDDGHALSNPVTSFHVVLGFRDYILAYPTTHGRTWDSWNVPLESQVGSTPLEVSNPSLGGGDQQAFRATVLEYTPARGVFEMWVGQEFLALRALAQPIPPPPPSPVVDPRIAEYQGLLTQINALSKL